MRQDASVSALIVTYQSRNEIGSCLSSLMSSSGARLLECVVVDNHSTDGTAETVESEFPAVRVERNKENLGFGRAINQAARLARGEYLWILNPDTRVHDLALSELALFMDHRANAGACGPKIVNVKGEFQRVSRRGFPTFSSAVGYSLGLDKIFTRGSLGSYHKRWLPEDREVQTDSLSGACMFVRKSVFESVGGFDQDYFLFGEDIDLCWKIAEAGFERWYVPSAVVTHVKGASMRHLGDRAGREFYRSMQLYVDKRLKDRYSPVTLEAIKAGVRLFQAVGRWM